MILPLTFFLLMKTPALFAAFQQWLESGDSFLKLIVQAVWSFLYLRDCPRSTRLAVVSPERYSYPSKEPHNCQEQVTIL